MKFRRRFLSSLAATFVVGSLAAETRAQCTAEIQVSGPVPTLASSPYDGGTTIHAWDPAHWFDDDVRQVEIGFTGPTRGDELTETSDTELRAALSRIELFVLSRDLPEVMLVQATQPQMGRLLKSLPAGARVGAALLLAEHHEWVDRVGQAHVNATFTLSPSDQLAPGEYWLIAALWLPKGSRLGCPEISPEGVFSQPVRLVITTTTTLKERAFVQYRRVLQVLTLHATDNRLPDYRHASPEQRAAELDAALDAAKKLVAVDATSALGWEMLAKVHEARHEAGPAIAAYRKAGELLVAGRPDIARIDEGTCWGMPSERRPARLQQRIDALSLPQPRFEDEP